MIRDIPQLLEHREQECEQSIINSCIRGYKGNLVVKGKSYYYHDDEYDY